MSATAPTLQSQLCAAVENEKVATVRRLLKEDAADPSVPGKSDPIRTPLYFAAKAGHVDLVRLLLEHNADINQARIDCGATPVYLAAQEGHADVVQVLLEHNADPNRAETSNGTTPVFVAAQNGHAGVVKVLLGHTANPADPTQAVTHAGENPVYIAAGKGHVECVEALMTHNADPNLAETGHGVTPVIMAALKGHADVVKVLLENNADPNQATNDSYGRSTPVHAAAGQRHVDVLKVLLGNNADPNPTLNDAAGGATPVLMAAEDGHVDVLRVLLENDADPNQAMAVFGQTPLHAAASAGKLPAAQLLVVHGASMVAVTASKRTPLDVATRNGQPLATWLNAVATWSPLRVAAALRMHAGITFLLKRGRLDPDDRVTFPAAEIMAAIAASTASPAELPWEDALPICRTTARLVHDASFGWKCSTHRLYHANVRKAVFAVLVVEDRLERVGRRIDNDADAADDTAPLLHLPPEIWLLIVHFFQRSWWHAVVV